MLLSANKVMCEVISSIKGKEGKHSKFKENHFPLLFGMQCHILEQFILTQFNGIVWYNIQTWPGVRRFWVYSHNLLY